MAIGTVIGGGANTIIVGIAIGATVTGAKITIATVIKCVPARDYCRFTPYANSADLIWAVNAGNPPEYRPRDVPDPGYFTDLVTGVAVDRFSRQRNARDRVPSITAARIHRRVEVIQNAIISGIALDSAGSVYFVGWGRRVADPNATLQIGFADPLYDDYSGFLKKLDSSGEPVYTVNVARDSLDLKVAVDASGNAYIAGYYSPATSGAYRTAFQEGTSIIKINPSGSAVVYVACAPGSGAGFHG